MIHLTQCIAKLKNNLQRFFKLPNWLKFEASQYFTRNASRQLLRCAHKCAERAILITSLAMKAFVNDLGSISIVKNGTNIICFFRGSANTKIFLMSMCFLLTKCFLATQFAYLTPLKLSWETFVDIYSNTVFRNMFETMWLF